MRTPSLVCRLTPALAALGALAALSSAPTRAHAEPPAERDAAPSVVIERTARGAVHRFTVVQTIRGERQQPLRFDVGTRARDTYVRPPIAPAPAPSVLRVTHDAPF